MTQDNTPESSEPTIETPGSGAPEPESAAPAKKAPAKKSAAKKTAAKKAPAKKAPAKKTTARKASAGEPVAEPAPETAGGTAEQAPKKKAAAKRAPAKRTVTKVAGPVADPQPAEATSATTSGRSDTSGKTGRSQPATEAAEADAPATAVLFQAPDTAKAPSKPRSRKQPEATLEAASGSDDRATEAGSAPADEARAGEAQGQQPGSGSGEGDDNGEGGGRRRRRRGGRRRRKSGGGEGGGPAEETEQSDEADDESSGSDDEQGESTSPSSRRRRRRRRAGDDNGDAGDDPQNTVTKVRQGRTAEDQITAVTGSTRLEAKKQRRREGREAGRRRAPIVSEAEFLARRESVDRVMAIRQRDDLTQIAVLEDKVLVEHYVARESQTSLIGNVYLGRVQNVLPSMEAAFIDIGKGRNAVLYAGEVNWSALGHKDGQPRKIESVLSSGQSVLVQVTKDPVGHKGARLTSQISLAGRFLVYVPDGTNSGISRKLPDTERNRLKALLKEIVPDGAGVIVRTAAEGASEDELTRDVERLRARWEDIEKKAKGNAPQLLYGEPDLTLKVVRDLFTEDFSRLVVQGEDAWDTVHAYVGHVAPDLEERLERHDPDKGDLFAAAYRIDEQIHKGLDRKVWLPSGGSLIIDRTEAMTVVDVNTGKFTGSGGNLEETVTKNNLEAAEEIVRQLRLRDIGGIIVVDFIDMVLESNRDLVLRRLVECLGRDRTRHQVAEVTSLGLVQMTRKRIGTGLLEAFSEPCEHCNGRGLVVADAPVEPKKADDDARRGSRRSRRGRGGNGGDSGGKSSGNSNGNGSGQARSGPSPKDVAAMARPPAAENGNGDQPDPDRQSGPAEQAPAQGKASGDGQARAGEESEPVEQSEQDAQRGQDETPQADERPEPGTGAEPAREDAGARGGEAPAEPDPAGSSEEPTEQAAPEQPAARPEPTEEPPAEPEAPRVVTRSRRRSASRPAGPPAGGAALADSQPGVGSIGSPPLDGAVEPGTADAEPASPPPVEHVPVKKRGSRKR